MSSFTEARFIIVPGATENGRPVYEADRDLRFWVGAPSSGLVLTIPRGFRTDLASIPAPLLAIGRALSASVTLWICDQLAKSAALHDRMRRDLQFALVDGDALFLVAMKADGVQPILREIAFLLVRLNRTRT